MGLVPIVPEPGAAYDSKAHDLFEGEKAADGAQIGQAVACGYTFQGQLVRKPVIVLQTQKRVEKEPVAQDILPGLVS